MSTSHWPQRPSTRRLVLPAAMFPFPVIQSVTSHDHQKLLAAVFPFPVIQSVTSHDHQKLLAAVFLFPVIRYGRRTTRRPPTQILEGCTRLLCVTSRHLTVQRSTTSHVIVVGRWRHFRRLRQLPGAVSTLRRRRRPCTERLLLPRRYDDVNRPTFTGRVTLNWPTFTGRRPRRLDQLDKDLPYDPQ